MANASPYLLAPFRDLKVIVCGQEMYHNKTILAQNSRTILNFLLECPTSSILTLPISVKPEYVWEYFDILYQNLPLYRSTNTIRPRSLTDDPLPFIVLAEYLEISKKEFSEFQSAARYYLRENIKNFVSNYQLPFTELSEKINYIHKFVKYPHIKEMFCSEIRGFDTTKVDKTAALIHCAKGIEEMEKWICKTLAKLTFPYEFCQRLGLPHIQDFVLKPPPQILFPEIITSEAPKYNKIDSPECSFRKFGVSVQAHKKRPRSEMELETTEEFLPLSKMDKEFLNGFLKNTHFKLSNLSSDL